MSEEDIKNLEDLLHNLLRSIIGKLPDENADEFLVIYCNSQFRTFKTFRRGENILLRAFRWLIE